MAYTLDTATATERLTAAGLDAEAARVIVAEVAQSISDLVTKDYLRGELASLERRLVMWAVALAGVLFAALRLSGG